jgi:CheY-like chemotaxis protein/predicted regulator of Ras-like GTPase activity (Roadblock/LC7/MglB family)
MTRVLVVDDSISVRKALERILAPQQLNVLAAESAEKALSLMPDANIDLVIADVVMPGMTGFELCQTLKSDPSYQHIPIMLISGIVNASVENQARQSGAVGVVKKPFTPDDLFPKIKQAMAKRGQPAVPATPQVATTPANIFDISDMTPTPVPPRPAQPVQPQAMQAVQPQAMQPQPVQPPQQPPRVQQAPQARPQSAPQAPAPQVPTPQAPRPAAPIASAQAAQPSGIPAGIPKPTVRPALQISGELRQRLMNAISPILEKSDVVSVMLVDGRGSCIINAGQEPTDKNALAGYVKFITSAAMVLGQNIGDKDLKSLVLEYAQQCVVVTKTEKIVVALVLRDITSLSIARYVLKKQIPEIDGALKPKQVVQR